MLRYFAYAELAGSGRAIVSGEVKLNIITPLAASITVPGPLAMGQTQKVKVTLVRRGDDKQPVDLKFKKLPPGVTGPDKTTLAADQTEVEIELSAAADAPAGKFAELAVVATSKYAGQDIAVDSPAVTLEVKSP